MVFDAFEGYEFTDRTGTIRTIYGCSSLGIFEFQQRLTALTTALNAAEDSQTWQHLYFQDPEFAHHLRQCLKLNNIDPDWVTLDMIGKLLFPFESSQGWKAGRLVALNTPLDALSTSSARTATPAEVVAAIATHTPSLPEAIELANTVPARQLQAVMQAKNQFAKLATEDGKKRELAKTNRAKAKRQIEALRDKLTG